MSLIHRILVFVLKFYEGDIVAENKDSVVTCYAFV
jgi:hypothetical protein